MPQISIPLVVFYVVEDQPKMVDITLLVHEHQVSPESYIDELHHGAIYCPKCGVMCSRQPRKKAKRKDNVDGFFFHLKDFEHIKCEYRKAGGTKAGDGDGKAKKAINLINFNGWKSVEDDDGGDEDEDGDQDKKGKREVARGSTGNRTGGELTFGEDGSLLKAGNFSTVSRLLQVARKSLDINVQFPGHEATRIGDLIISVEKLQKNSERYIGKSWLIYGVPTSIESGKFKYFYNFASPGHKFAIYCDREVVMGKEWQGRERGRYYLFYGLLERRGDNSTVVRVTELGQAHRVSLSARKFFSKVGAG
ncbi:hypothetical protein NJC38_25450 [Pseudomonas sp. 21LCFQ010]|uniref:hypothetical protein n=1 Tax=Pseudomonas sp. 21LCFQ010 TaxID=2957506 RepID=UPI0020970523|nr:hypothetical protein [Pseudomonas sp. 21LCFQ010]MCO8165487.1 hypothetical protein [Pseudomonas sp. 21LCFQ010]